MVLLEDIAAIKNKRPQAPRPNIPVILLPFFNPFSKKKPVAHCTSYQKTSDAHNEDG